MNRRVTTALFIYGSWLFLVGVVGFLSNPEKAKTALMSGGLFGSLSLLWGVLIHKGVRWAIDAAMGMTAFVTMVFTWRAWVSWSAVLQGQSEKMIAALLISALWLASVIVLPILWRSARHGGGFFNRTLDQ